MSQFPAETSHPSQTEIHLSKRKRGGQPGNTNALKHGLYLAGNRLRNSARVEAHIPDIYDLIAKLKRSIQVTYEVNLGADNLAESTEALRSLSLAVNGLIRLINLSNKSGKSTFSPGLDEFSTETYQALLAKYKQLHADDANPAGSQQTL